jgi:PBSX family phage portal protein
MAIDPDKAADLVASTSTAIAKATIFSVDRSAQSTAAALPEEQNGTFTAAGAIVPPYDPATLCLIYENSGSLQPNVAAYSTNIEAFGFRLEPVIDLDAKDVDEKISDTLLQEHLADRPDQDVEITQAQIDERKDQVRRLARIEKLNLELFFEYCSSDGSSFVDLRERTRTDLEVTGNAYWEVIRNGLGEICQLGYVPALTTRVLRADTKPFPYAVPQKISAISYRTKPLRRKFRRYVQIVNGVDKVFFKDFQDPRIYSSQSGRPYLSLMEMHAAEGINVPEANEMLHFKIHSPRSVYGVPRWIGQMLAVLGSRASEEVNYLYFDNKAVPPLAVLVSGGKLGAESVDRIKGYVNSTIKGRDNFHSIMVIEAESANAGGVQNGRLRIELQPLTQAQQQDALFQQYKSNNDESVGSSFRVPRILRGQMNDFNRACYSADTETLTEHGWKRHEEIAPGERIATFRPETMELRFEVPVAKYLYEVDEPLVHFTNRSTDILVTPDHKMLVRCPSRGWTAEPASETAKRGRFEFACAPEIDVSGEALAPVALPKVCQVERGHGHAPIDPADWLEFLGYYLSDGGLLETDHPIAPYVVFIRQKKQPYQDQMRACLGRIGWAFAETTKKDGTVVFTISNRCLRDWLITKCGGRSATRHLPEGYAETLPRAQLAVLWDAMKAGDGGAGRTDENGCYYSASKAMIDGAQVIALRLGLRTHVRWQEEAGVFRAMWSRNTTIQLDALDVEVVPYKGEVYCFSCPNAGFFVTRRNGKIAIQGNTANAALEYVEEQVFQPERQKIDHAVNTKLLAQMGIRFWKFVSNSPIARDPDALTTMISSLVEKGILTINEGRAVAADIFNRPYQPHDAWWANQPLTLSMAGVQSGQLAPPKGDAGPVAEKGQPPPGKGPPGAPGADQKDLVDPFNAQLEALQSEVDRGGADPRIEQHIQRLAQALLGANRNDAIQLPPAQTEEVQMPDGRTQIVLRIPSAEMRSWFQPTSEIPGDAPDNTVDG